MLGYLTRTLISFDTVPQGRLASGRSRVFVEYPYRRQTRACYHEAREHIFIEVGHLITLPFSLLLQRLIFNGLFENVRRPMPTVALS